MNDHFTDTFDPLMISYNIMEFYNTTAFFVRAVGIRGVQATPPIRGTMTS